MSLRCYVVLRHFMFAHLHNSQPYYIILQVSDLTQSIHYGPCFITLVGVQLDNRGKQSAACYLGERRLASVIRWTQTSIAKQEQNQPLKTTAEAFHKYKTKLTNCRYVAPSLTNISKELATSRMILRARGKPELPLLTDIDFHPRPRLKSDMVQPPGWGPDHPTPLAHAVAEPNRWRPKQVLHQGPYHLATGNGPARGQCSLLNRFQMDAGPCRNSMPRHSATAVNTKPWCMLWTSARWLASTVASQNYI